MSRAGSLAKGMEPVPGHVLNHLLGRGGWGSVWKATRQDGSAIALKFLPCESPAAAVQEVRALQAIRQLKHSNLIKIEQIWSIPGYVIVAMELAEGSLLDLLNVYQSEYQQPIFAEHVCFYLRQVATALDFLNARQHYVNEQRVAFRHCDVKPSNLLILGQQVKLADFSLSVQATSSMWYHRRVGTLNYCAPELLQGWLSDRSDQFSLAVTYCHLRSGELPFPEDDAGLLRPAQARPAPNLSMLTAAEQSIIGRALAAVPQDRWPSCTELLDRLEDVVSPTSAAVR